MHILNLNGTDSHTKAGYCNIITEGGGGGRRGGTWGAYNIPRGGYRIFKGGGGPEK